MSENLPKKAKFKPAPIYEKDEIQRILFEKIQAENNLIIESSMDEKLPQQVKRKSQTFSIMSLFSGCGGLDFGAELAGIEASFGEQAATEAYYNKEKFDSYREKSIFHTIYSNDLFKESSISYRENFGDQIVQDTRDIRKIKHFPLCDVILGGFPCPGFSAAGPRLIDDERNFLYIHFIRAIMQAKPKIFVAENVKGLLNLGGGEVARQIIEDFASAGYKVQYKLLNARDFGVPQLRERVFIIGVRNDLNYNYEFPEPTHGVDKAFPFVTLREAIGDLPENPQDVFQGGFSTIYLSRNRKKSWHDQAFTIQASGRQAQLWPGGEPMQKVHSNLWNLIDLNRRLSVRESARIQTFPDWWYFSQGIIGSKTSENNRLDKQYKQIGNAVPVLLAKQVLLPIANWAESLKKKNKLIQEEISQLSLF